MQILRQKKRKKRPKNYFFLHFALFYTLYDNAEKRICHSPFPNLSSVNKTRKVSYPEISRHYYPPPPTTGTREAQMERRAAPYPYSKMCELCELCELFVKTAQRFFKN